MAKRLSGAPGCYCSQLVGSTCDFCSGLRTMCAVEGCRKEGIVQVPKREMKVCKGHADEGIGLPEMTLKSWKLGMLEPMVGRI